MVRGDSLKLGGAAAVVALGVLVFGLLPDAFAGGAKRHPKIVYAEYTNDPDNASNYRFKAGAIRATSVQVQLQESPAEGQTTGPKESITMTKQGGSSSPEIWTGTTSKTRPAPCYRAAFIARSSRGKYVRAYRMCAFAQPTTGSRRVTLKPW